MKLCIITIRFLSINELIAFPQFSKDTSQKLIKNKSTKNNMDTPRVAQPGRASGCRECT